LLGVLERAVDGALVNITEAALSKIGLKLMDGFGGRLKLIAVKSY